MVKTEQKAKVHFLHQLLGLVSDLAEAGQEISSRACSLFKLTRQPIDGLAFRIAGLTAHRGHFNQSAIAKLW